MINETVVRNHSEAVIYVDSEIARLNAELAVLVERFKSDVSPSVGTLISASDSIQVKLSILERFRVTLEDVRPLSELIPALLNGTEIFSEESKVRTEMVLTLNSLICFLRGDCN